MNEVVDDLVGRKCWSVVAGVGSILSLGFGKKILRAKPLANTQLKDDVRKYDAEFKMMIYCSWRLSDPGGVLCGWRDSNDNNQVVLDCLSSLEGMNVMAVKLDSLTLDLSILFEKNISLSIFCDQTSDFDSDENYTVSRGEFSCTAGLKSKIEVESNDE